MVGSAGTIFPIGSRVRVTREKLQRNVGQEGEIITVPSQPNSWYRIRLADGSELRLRKTHFEPVEGFDAFSGGQRADRSASNEEEDAADILAAAAGSGDGIARSGNPAGTATGAAVTSGGAMAATGAANSTGATDVDNKAKVPEQLNKDGRQSSSSSLSSNNIGDEDEDKTLFNVNRRVRIRELNNSRSRVSHLIGQIGVITETPQHPNTWFTVRMEESGETYKFQSPGLMPIGDDGKELSLAAGDEDDEDDEDMADAGEDEDASEASRAGSSRRRSSRPLVACKRSGMVASDKLLADTDPNRWIGARVIIKSAQFEGEVAIVQRSGNGWVQLRRDETGPEANVEFARRATELVVPIGSPLLDGDANGTGNGSNGNNGRRLVDDDGNDMSTNGSEAGDGNGLDADNENDDDEDSLADSSSNANGRTPPRRKPSRRGAGAAQADRNNQQTNGLVGRRCVITYGSKLGTVGTILSGNGYWYIGTAEKKVRKKRDQFEVLQEAVPVLGELIKSEADAPRMLQATTENAPEGEQSSGLQVTHFSKTYFVLRPEDTADEDDEDDDPIAKHHEDVNFIHMPKAILRNFFVKIGQLTAENDQSKSGDASGKKKRGGGPLSVRSTSEPGTRGRANTRRTANTAVTTNNANDDDSKSSVAGSTTGGGSDAPRRQTRNPRRSQNRSKAKIKAVTRIPLTDDPKINRLLNANKERQDAIHIWMTHDKDRHVKYNQHRPDLKLWRDRICGDDDSGDKYVPPVVKVPRCDVCQLEKHSENSSCWNPACWASPVFEKGAAPLDEGLALPKSKEDVSTDYAFAVVQSPRKPGFIEVPEAAFPYVYSMDDRDWGGAIREAQVETTKVSAKGKNAGKKAAEATKTRTPPPEAELRRARAVNRALVKGWGRFVAGRKRMEEQTIISPLETYHYRAIPVTLGRRKRPLDEPRDQGLNGYFGMGWNEELARPYFDSRKKRRQEDADLWAQEGHSDSEMEDAQTNHSDGNDDDDDDSSVDDDWETDDLTGLDYRWRSWQGMQPASHKPDSHPTFTTAASIMSLGTGQIDEKQLKTLKDDKKTILKEVDRKLAKSASLARSISQVADIKPGKGMLNKKAGARATGGPGRFSPQSRIEGAFPGIPGASTLPIGSIIGNGGMQIPSLSPAGSSKSPASTASKKSRGAKNKRRANSPSPSPAVPVSDDPTARIQSMFQNILDNRAAQNSASPWQSAHNASLSAAANGSEISPLQQLQQLHELQQQLANATNASPSSSSLGSSNTPSSSSSKQPGFPSSSNSSNPTTTLLANLFSSNSSSQGLRQSTGSGLTLPGDLMNALQHGQHAMNLLSNLQQQQQQQQQQQHGMNASPQQHMSLEHFQAPTLSSEAFTQQLQQGRVGLPFPNRWASSSTNSSKKSSSNANGVGSSFRKDS